MICIGVSNVNSLHKVKKLMAENHIIHYAWTEPDNDLGFTSLATVPLDDEQRKVFAKYKLWNEDTPVAQKQSALTLNQGDEGSNPSRCANAESVVSKDTGSELQC